MNTEIAEELKISLPSYEGPLDLLLDLIRQQKIDIYDIPIAKVTEQYLSYLHLLQEMNVDLASEFLLMAAQLIYIKSRMLLPPDPDAPPDELEDPRAELVRRLIEYEKFRNAAQMLYQREMIENASWSNPGAIALEETDLEPEMAIGLFDLIVAFREVLKRTEEKPTMDIHREEFSIEQMMGYLFENILASRGKIGLKEILLVRADSKRTLITAFLALLELTRLKAIYLTQEQPFAEIMAQANPNYELSRTFTTS